MHAVFFRGNNGNGYIAKLAQIAFQQCDGIDGNGNTSGSMLLFGSGPRSRKAISGKNATTCWKIPAPRQNFGRNALFFSGI